MAKATIHKLKTRPDDIAAARAAITTEIKGLQELADTLDDAFARAVDKIDAMKKTRQGRLIVAGIGKSGHVARKIAATLASTGTPAYYLHPGEASHGDLGIVTDSDIVILISNSGESAEQGDLIAYAKRFGILLIGITSNPGSTLGKAADITLKLPKVPEACPNGLAPTTSTTMTMALGDALAVALLARSGLTAEQFKVFHPGGKLGQKLLQVADLMVKGGNLPVVRPATTMDNAIVAMTEKNVGCVVVADKGGKLLGIVTDGDLKRHMGPKLLAQKVSSVMSTKPETITPDTLAMEAVNRMLQRKKGPITSLVVLDKGKVVGLIRVHECLQAGLV